MINKIRVKSNYCNWTICCLIHVYAIKDEQKKHTWLFEFRVASFWPLQATVEHWQTVRQAEITNSRDVGSLAGFIEKRNDCLIFEWA